MERQNGALVREQYEARVRGDLDAVRSVLAGEVLWHEPEVGERAGDLRGAEAARGTIRGARKLTDGTFDLRPHEVVAYGDKVAEVWFLPDNSGDDEEFWAS